MPGFREAVLRPKQGGRNDGDPVAPAIGLWTGRDDDGIEQVVAETTLEPDQMPNVGVLDRAAQFDLHGDYALIVAFHDQVDFLLPSGGSEVAHRRLGCLGVDADRERDERLEKMA